MNTYRHESVEHNPHIPAMIAILDYQSAKHYFPTDIFIPSHWHRSLEISLIEHVEVTLQIGEHHTVVKDDFTCVNSGVVHSLHAGEIQADSSCIILLLSYDFMKQYCPDVDTIYFDLSLHKDHEPLKQLYYRLRDLYLNQDTYTYLAITACIFELFNCLLTYYKAPMYEVEQVSSKNQNQIKEVLTYLHEHYQEEITLIGISDYFHVSNEYFSRQFHHYVGKTFRDYLSNYRMYKAYDDIIHSDMTIQDIARKHGFLNVRSFIKLFTKLYHDTPAHYRKKYQKNTIK